MEYGWAAATPIFCTALAWLIHPYFRSANLLVVYLTGIVVLAVRVGRGPALLGAGLSVLAFDSFFLRPSLKISALDTQYFATLGIIVALAVFISDQSQRIRAQTRAARRRERWTAALDAMSRQLAGASRDEVAPMGARHLGELFDAAVVILLPDDSGGLAPQCMSPDQGDNPRYDPDVAAWVWRRGESAGPGTPNFSRAEAWYLPLVATRQTIGVLVMRLRRPPPEDVREHRTLAAQSARRVALAVERRALLEEAQQARIRFETERIRNTLLSAVSHDLRTPMAAIKGAATSLIEGHRSLSGPTRLELAEAIRDEADRLTRLVHNLLDMTRLESGSTIRCEWHSLEEIVGVALASVESQLGAREVSTELPDDLPLIMVDGVLIQQILVNLLENAAKYTPPATPVQISAATAEGVVTVRVADRGPGLATPDLDRVFEKFYRGPGAGAGGLGLGLSICQSIVHAHGGRIWAENRAGGGTAFCFQLPTSAPLALSEPVPDPI